MDEVPQRNNNNNNNKRNDSNIDDEVQKLFRKTHGKFSSNDFSHLRKKFDDIKLVEKIQTAFLQKHAHISKRAKKFAYLIREKYGNRQYPFHYLLEKARLFKAKHNLTEDEFAEFQRIYEQELIGTNSEEVFHPITNMNKALGTVSLDMHPSTLKLDETDYKYLQEIIKHHAMTKPLHAQVTLQSMQYTDCDFEATSGIFDRSRGDNPLVHIHPVVAALFFPKFNIIEKFFLHANIAGIVTARYNNAPFVSSSDYELFYNLTTDPNDIVCDNRSSVLDLLNRARVQEQLWNSVLNLRNGNYFASSIRDFISSIDICKLNKNDNPDLIYARFDGTVLKRLVSVFSFRPTFISVMPSLQNNTTLNPYFNPIRPVVSSIPMINFRIPYNPEQTIDLAEFRSQSQLFLINGVLSTRSTNVHYSREVLIFYIDRRSHTIRFNANPLFSINRLPLSISGFERINTTAITVPEQIPLDTSTYYLRSAVVAETSKITPETDTVIGSSTIIYRKLSTPLGIGNREVFKYSPLNVIHKQMPGTDRPNRVDPRIEQALTNAQDEYDRNDKMTNQIARDNAQVAYNQALANLENEQRQFDARRQSNMYPLDQRKPIEDIPNEPTFNNESNGISSAKELVQQYGIIFIYASDEPDNDNVQFHL